MTLHGLPQQPSTLHPQVTGLGLVVLDQVVFVDHYPDCDSKVVATSQTVQVGGPVPTALAQLNRLGVPTRLVGVWSHDHVGRAIESRLTHDGIAFDPSVCRTAKASGFAHVWVETRTGRRTVVSMPPEGDPSAEDAVVSLRGATVVHLDGWGGDAAIAVAKATHAAGGVVTLDAGSRKPATERLLPFVTMLNAPKRFATSFCETSDVTQAAQQLFRRGPRIVTITDGEHGAGIFTADVAQWLPAFPVAAVDTCGAGDVFCGGLIYAMLAGMQPVEMLRFAMATAAAKVGRSGNRQLATHDEVLAVLNAFERQG